VRTTTTTTIANNATNNAIATLITVIATPNPTNVEINAANTAALNTTSTTTTTATTTTTTTNNATSTTTSTSSSTTTTTNTNAELHEKLTLATNVNGNLIKDVNFLWILLMEPKRKLKVLMITKTVFAAQSGKSHMEQLHCIK